MKYFIRSVKYFIYFALLSTLIIVALVLTGMTEGNIETMFEGGYTAIWKMAGFFAVVATFYPKIGFIRKDILSAKGWADDEGIITSYMREHDFEVETVAGETVTFRHRKAINRLSRMFEDRITLTIREGGYEMEGLRKDVYRLATGLEYRLNPQQD